MGSKKTSNSLASSLLLMNDRHEHINKLHGLDLEKVLPKFQHKFPGLIPRAIEEMRKGKEELAEADKLLESLKAKYEADKDRPSSKKLYEYRERKSPYSTCSSTPACSPPMESPIDDLAVSKIKAKTCSVCEKVFSSRQSMLRHVSRKHPDPKDAVEKEEDGLEDLLLQRLNHNPNPAKKELNQNDHHDGHEQFKPHPVVDDGSEDDDLDELLLNQLNSGQNDGNGHEHLTYDRKNDDALADLNDDDRDDDLDDLLLQQLNPDPKDGNGQEQLDRNDDDGEDEDDLDELLLQQLNS